MSKRRSFFERLTGAINIDADTEESAAEAASGLSASLGRKSESRPAGRDWLAEEAGEAQLGVDVYETNDEIIVKAMVAGVRPEDLDISISREIVEIKGKREESRTVREDNYIHRELYWGPFSRSVVLPNEVEVEEAEAVEKNGLLIIRMPKINKNQQTRLKVKAGG